MFRNRSELLIPAREVEPSEVQWYFFTAFYDAPVSGLALFRGEIHRFCCFEEDIPDQCVYVLHGLDPRELARELLAKRDFEESVGTHCSFDESGKPLPKIEQPEALSRDFFVRNPPTPAPSPWDAEVVAWFDRSKPSTPAR